MQEQERHQTVLDQAWAWLSKRHGWFDRRAAGDERIAQLWRWNKRQGPIDV